MLLLAGLVAGHRPQAVGIRSAPIPRRPTHLSQCLVSLSGAESATAPLTSSVIPHEFFIALVLRIVDPALAGVWGSHSTLR